MGALLLAGCTGAKEARSPSVTPAKKPPPTGGGAASTTTRMGGVKTGVGALQAEAKAAATGDIPDNQVFLTFRNRRAGYSIRYPEGWAQIGSGNRVTFRDKNNIVRVVVVTGRAPTLGQVRGEMRHLPGARVVQPPTRLVVAGAPAIKGVYLTQSAPNPVTGKRVTLVVDRYYLWRADTLAIVDLGTPRGVDNVDAYRLMIESFRWR